MKTLKRQSTWNMGPCECFIEDKSKGFLVKKHLYELKRPRKLYLRFLKFILKNHFIRSENEL